MTVTKENRCRMDHIPTDCFSSSEISLPDDSSNEGKKSASSSGGLPPTFTMNLHEMLEIECLETVVSWRSHGRSFMVHNQPIFVRDVLPRFFRAKKFTSFVRQLNLYNFRRITRGKDKGSYYHPKFLRGRPSLAGSMRRTRKKNTFVRSPSNPDTEPDFYSMPPIDDDCAPQPTDGNCPTQPSSTLRRLNSNEFDVKCDRISSISCIPNKTKNQGPPQTHLPVQCSNLTTHCSKRHSWPLKFTHLPGLQDHVNTLEPKRNSWSHEAQYNIAKITDKRHQFADVFGGDDLFGLWNKEPSKESEDSDLYSPMPYLPTREELDNSVINICKRSLFREDFRQVQYGDAQYCQSRIEETLMIDPVPSNAHYCQSRTEETLMIDPVPLMAFEDALRT